MDIVVNDELLRYVWTPMRPTEAERQVQKLRELRKAATRVELACTEFARLAVGIAITKSTHTPAELRDEIVKLCKSQKSGITRSEIVAATGANAVKVRWALRQLRADGYVTMSGAARGSCYSWAGIRLFK